MDKLIIKDNETGNLMEIYYSKNEIIIDTENDKAEIKGTFNDFERVLINNAKALDLEIQISEEVAFGKILKLINKNYSKLKITYTVKHEENIVLDVIEDFSKNISENTEFEIHCTGGTDWIAKINGWLIYGHFMSAKQRSSDKLNTLSDRFEYLRKKLKEQIKKMSQ